MLKRTIKIAVLVVVALCLLGTAFFVYLQEFHSTEIYCEYALDNGYCVTVYQIGSPQWSFGPVTTKIVLRDADGKTVDKCTFELNNDGGSVNVINIADIRWKNFGVEVDMHGADDKGVTTYSLSSSSHNKDQFSGETSSVRTSAVLKAWTGEFSEEKLMAAINEYQSKYTPIVIESEVTSAVSFEVDFEVSSCSVVRLSKVDDANTSVELRGYIDLFLSTNCEGKNVTIPTGWWYRDYTSWVKEDYPIWSYLIRLKDVDGAEHYYYFRVNYSKKQLAEETPSETVRVSIPDLTMATLKSLVDICGEDLTWDTFAPYWYKDFSSDIYILRYPIGADYCLVISGASMEEPPEKIILEALHSPENYIDIRTESIDDFIASGVAANATAMAKENALNIALEHCKTNWNYTTIKYYFDADEWDVEFWENAAKIAAQRVTLDKDGNVLRIRYAE